MNSTIHRRKFWVENLTSSAQVAALVGVVVVAVYVAVYSVGWCPLSLIVPVSLSTNKVELAAWQMIVLVDYSYNCCQCHTLGWTPTVGCEIAVLERLTPEV
jgi:hypothetical protein